MARLSHEAEAPAGVFAAQEAEVLSRITALFQVALPLDEVLKRILRGLTEGLDIERAELYMLDERDRVLVGHQVVFQHDTHDPDVVSSLPGERIPVANPREVLSAAALEGKTQIIDDLGAPGSDLTLHALLNGRVQSGSFAAVPLLACGQVVGVITLNDSRGGRLSLRDRIPLLNAYAVHAGLAIERARLYEDRERAIRDLTHLQKMTANLQESRPMDVVLSRILEGVTGGIEADRAILYLHDPVKRILKGAHAAPPELASIIRSIEIPVNGSEEVMSATVLQRRPFVVDRVIEGLSVSPVLKEHLQIDRFIAAPLMAQGKVVGVITVDSFRGAQTIRERLHLLMAYSVQAGLAIDRTVLEEKLRASEKQHRELIELSPDGIAETTIDGKILSCNEALARILGYTREELLTINAGDLYAEGSQRGGMVSRCMTEGSIGGALVGVRTKDGTIKHVSVSMRVRREDGGPVLESIIRDFTDQYEIERRLRALTNVVNYSADAIIAVGPECQVTSWNLGAESIFGYTASEMIGHPYQTLVPEELRLQFTEVIRRRVETEGRLQGFETERLRKDGARIPVSITVTRLQQIGGPDLGWSVVVRDITQRRREEQQRRLLSSITQQSPDAILSVSSEGKITSWNRGARKIFGYSEADIVGRCWLELAPAERQADYRLVMAQSAGETSPLEPSVPRTIDTVARARDGSFLPVGLSASVLRGGDGAEVGWSVIFRDLTETRTLAEISERLSQELYRRNRLEGIVGISRPMEEIRDRIRRVARFNSSVLLVGPSGTGKEVVANAIHFNSPRRDKPLVKVNCAAIPDDLLESELFGIERNVATGVDGRIGRFEMADGGTLFLDEIGDMTLATQAKILRALQEREFERVGGKKVIKVDVRIIAATNKNLAEEIKARRFRDDLYYRLNVIVITLPALSARREDIDPLIDHFLERVSHENDLPRRRLTLAARMLLNEYDWPGNVRELEHCIERAVVMSEEAEVLPDDLPPHILIWKELGTAGGDRGLARGGLADAMLEVEKRTVVDALDRSGWVQAKAARLIGISERSMWYRVKKLGIGRPTH